MSHMRLESWCVYVAFLLCTHLCVLVTVLLVHARTLLSHLHEQACTPTHNNVVLLNSSADVVTQVFICACACCILRACGCVCVGAGVCVCMCAHTRVCVFPLSKRGLGPCCINLLSVHAYASRPHLLLEADCGTHIMHARILLHLWRMHGQYVTQQFSQAPDSCCTLELALDCFVHW